MGACVHEECVFCCGVEEEQLTYLSYCFLGDGGVCELGEKMDSDIGVVA
jgi:hypothetical protein